MASCCDGSVMVRREPVCRAHRDWELTRAALLSLKGAPRLHGVASLCVGDETTEPPAHCRLVSSHDLFEMVASLDCIAWELVTENARRGELGKGIGPFPVVRQERHSPRSRQVFARAPGRAGQGRRCAARVAGRLARARERARDNSEDRWSRSGRDPRGCDLANTYGHARLLGLLGLAAFSNI